MLVSESLTISVCNMKRVIKYLILAFAVGVIAVGCKDNFNELTDSDQRYIRFEFDSSDYFSNLLFEDGNGGFKMGAPFALLDSELLRITAYCYDEESKTLVAQKEILSSDGKNLAIEFERLLKGKQYRFLFFADIVERDAELGYLETWYQLLVKSYDTFYLMRRHINTLRAQKDILLRKEVILAPCNQVEIVNFESYTYNGYISLTNYDQFKSASIKVSCTLVAYLSSGSYKDSSYTADRDHTNFNKSIFVTNPKVGENLTVELSMVEFSGAEKNQTVTVPISAKPFVLQIDCQNLTYELCDNF